MNENELCKLIKENSFGKTCNQWHIFKIIHNGKVALFEVMIPTKGNIKVRKPIRKLPGDHFYTHEYQVYRITNKNTLFDLGIFNGTAPDLNDKANLKIYEIVA